MNDWNLHEETKSAWKGFKIYLDVASDSIYRQLDGHLDRAYITGNEDARNEIEQKVGALNKVIRYVGDEQLVKLSEVIDIVRVK